MMLEQLHIVLVHWPIRNKIGDTISTATTNLDIHDIARLAKTYGVARYWIVQPLTQQFDMIHRVLDHWVSGPGRALHPDRPTALENVRAVRSLEDIQAAISPLWVTTTAQPQNGMMSVADFVATHRPHDGSRPIALCFGTGWGLTQEVLDASDICLEPIAISDYNHLSVRSAVSIYLDRIWNATLSC